MMILGLLGKYFDAAVVFVTKSSLLFRLAVAILWAYWADSLSVLFAIKKILSQTLLGALVENLELNKWHQLSYGNSQSGQNVYVTMCFTLGFTNFRGPSQETWYQKGQVINTLPC